jgi:putative transposase
VPRKPRLQIEDATYHVTAAGCNGRVIFHDAEDRLAFLTICSTAVRQKGWECLAYCLMGTHYHLVLVTPQANLSTGMQRLNWRYARYLNRRHGGSGAVFKSRFHSTLIETDSHLREVLRYVALNPVRAGLRDRPEEWRWSSYASAIGLTAELPFVASLHLLELFAARPKAARMRLRRFVEDGLGGGFAGDGVPDTCLTPVVGC